MESWIKCKKWIRDTFSFTYIKKLINSDTNDDLKDAMAVFFSVIVAVICIYTVAKGNDGTRLSVIFYLIGFISTLTGLKTVKEMQHKYSDNKTSMAIKASVKDGENNQ